MIKMTGMNIQAPERKRVAKLVMKKACANKGWRRSYEVSLGSQWGILIVVVRLRYQAERRGLLSAVMVVESLPY